MSITLEIVLTCVSIYNVNVYEMLSDSHKYFTFGNHIYTNLELWWVCQIKGKIQEFGVSRSEWPNFYICDNNGTRLLPRQLKHMKYRLNVSKVGKDDLICVLEAMDV